VLNKPSADDRGEIDAAIARALDVLPLIVEGDLQNAMLKLHTAEKPPKAAEKTPADKAAPEKARAAEKPAKPAKVAPAPASAAPAKPAPAAAAVATPPAEPAAAAAEKKVGLKSLFRKFLPDQK
jgi:hypothetical protein